MTKPTKWLCAQRRLRSAWASAQSDQSLRCPHKEALGPYTHWAHSEDLIRLGGWPILVFTWRTLIMLVLSCRGSYRGWWLTAREKKFAWRIIRILHVCEVRIENSVPWVTLPSDAKQDPEGRNFQSAPNTHVWFFFLHTVPMFILKVAIITIHNDFDVWHIDIWRHCNVTTTST